MAKNKSNKPLNLSFHQGCACPRYTTFDNTCAVCLVTLKTLIPFGKYAGHSVEELLSDKSYLRWLAEQPRIMSWLERRHPDLHRKIVESAPSLDDRIQAFVAAAPPAVSSEGGSYRTFS